MRLRGGARQSAAAPFGRQLDTCGGKLGYRFDVKFAEKPVTHFSQTIWEYRAATPGLRFARGSVVPVCESMESTNPL
jgi:hypothetical protein